MPRVHTEGNLCKPCGRGAVILSWISVHQRASAENASCRTPARLAQAHACRYAMHAAAPYYAPAESQLGLKGETVKIMYGLRFHV